ncbi:MAG TPA: cytochrome P450 [Variovorax sp.]|nr:cytochrome P450 [Variovorax sp.]
MREWFGRAMTWARYHAVSAVVHQPRLLRFIARTAQQQPWFARIGKMVASRADVVGTFDRPLAFSSTAHRPQLVAGDFMMGMESGPQHSAERALLVSHLPKPGEFERCAVQESRKRIDALLAGPVRAFDLIDDYMVPVAWQAIGGAFGAALPTLAPGDPMLLNLRYVGAHLIAGNVATEAVQARARRSAAELNAWARQHMDQLYPLWSDGGKFSRDVVARNVVGMLWVGHPATAQSGALIMQELLARRAEPAIKALIERVRTHADPWNDPSLRNALKLHVLELLRFRPPFPILTRDVRRDTLYGADGKSRAQGGTTLTLMAIGAMFDPAATGEPPDDYVPERSSFHSEDDRFLLFGWGKRQCPGRDPVVEILAAALLGLLQLPKLDWADPWWRRLRYDGPIISSMRLKFREKD